MKKIAILIVLIIAPIITNAQSFFDTLEDMDGVNLVVVTKDAFEMISKFKNAQVNDNEAIKVFQMIQELNELKVFSTDNGAAATKMDGMISSFIKTRNLTELMRVKDKNSRVKIYVKATENKDYVSEVLMFMKGDQKNAENKLKATLVSLTGSIDINKMSELADTFATGK
ncbi:DUF4252 domain-containing protein [uncultured Polaribacter sp.]|uniref:DUF4252 domain-containing protein n=1 Tax=uncultured Polaribacter sp. TaxID=174711 RepID=UPI00260D0395|nr:DUF4252 domain-containing protein [uncultured Polaribacter sp.]